MRVRIPSALTAVTTPLAQVMGQDIWKCLYELCNNDQQVYHDPSRHVQILKMFLDKMALPKFSNVNNKYLVRAESISSVNLLSLALCLATSLSNICCSGATTNCSTCISWSSASLAKFISILAQSDKMELGKKKFWLTCEKWIDRDHT